jgi:hypothetical protein
MRRWKEHDRAAAAAATILVRSRRRNIVVALRPAYRRTVTPLTHHGEGEARERDELTATFGSPGETTQIDRIVTRPNAYGLESNRG